MFFLTCRGGTGICEPIYKRKNNKGLEPGYSGSWGGSLKSVWLHATHKNKNHPNIEQQ